MSVCSFVPFAQVTKLILALVKWSFERFGFRISVKISCVVYDFCPNFFNIMNLELKILMTRNIRFCWTVEIEWCERWWRRHNWWPCSAHGGFFLQPLLILIIILRLYFLLGLSLLGIIKVSSLYTNLVFSMNGIQTLEVVQFNLCDCNIASIVLSADSFPALACTTLQHFLY